MLPSPAPKYYLIGVLLSALGSLVLALRGRRGKESPRPRIPLAVGIVALGLGVAIIGMGVVIDLEYNTRFNTTTLSYDVSLQMNGSWSVRILLPAPSEPRFYDALNVTNGTASLRLNHTGTDTNVVLNAQGNVTFRVRAQVPTAATDRTFTRLTACGLGRVTLECNVTLEVNGLPAGMKAYLILHGSLGVGCEWHTLDLVSWVSAGTSEYPAQAPTAVC
jgi:hypothetical protein